MDYGISGKTALVTGAKKGIGYTAAVMFARAGVKTAFIDIEDTKEETEKLQKEGFDALPVKCDVSNKRQVKEAVEKIVSYYGCIDIAFNNAGIQTPQKPMHQITTDEYLKTINVDLSGIWYFMHYEIEYMLKQGSGVIINTSSQGGVTGFPGQAAYIACKHAVIGLTRTAAIDYAKNNIRINAVCPGAVLTPMTEELIQRNRDVETALLRDIPMGRLGNPDEIAHAVLWLASSGASFITGQALIVDGGFTVK
ncbi:MAG: SDR family oxidoreductase [Mucispirillum sp.]|nr:SDR family oxidoreductase [Mucispirillum sp.]